MHELSQRFMFEAAHTLQRDFETEGSRRVHGHTYFAEVTVAGVPDAENGMVLDLGELRTYIEAVREDLDHRMLDDVQTLGPATLENLCTYIARRLRPFTPGLSAVKVWREASGDSCRLLLQPTEHKATAKTRSHVELPLTESASR
jgi:6-pyruvoyltetrahydropterin/6-carboxytetrahydropterin synthase